MCPDPVVPTRRKRCLDFRKVEVLTPSFADEILKAWPKATPVGANKDVQISWDLAADR